VKQHELSPANGSKKDRKRVGRGDGSGNGTYSGRGCKGQKSRSGCKIRPGFEGGQLPIIKRLPRKRGFTSLFRKEYKIVKLATLNIFEANSEVTPEALLDTGVIKSLNLPVKILADGDIKHPLTVKANKFSTAAKTRLEAAGGKAVEVSYG
jgi:large subunit ribosomal protein L15